MKSNYLFSCLLLCVLTGCGESVTVITGTVKFEDGTPLTVGAVVFSNEKHSFQGKIGSDGSYAMKDPAVSQGLPNGNYKVWIAGSEKKEKPTTPRARAVITHILAEKFRSSSATDLTFEVKPGCPKTFDITVQKQQL